MYNKTALAIAVIAGGVVIYYLSKQKGGGRELEPAGKNNIVKWTGGVTLVGDAIAPIRSKVSIFYLLNYATNSWMSIAGNIWDIYAIGKGSVCGIIVTEACTLPSGFVWVD